MIVQRNIPQVRMAAVRHSDNNPVCPLSWSSSSTQRSEPVIVLSQVSEGRKNLRVRATAERGIYESLMDLFLI